MSNKLRHMELGDLKALYYQLEDDLQDAHDDKHDAYLREDFEREMKAWQKADRLSARMAKDREELKRRGHTDCWTLHLPDRS